MCIGLDPIPYSFFSLSDQQRGHGPLVPPPPPPPSYTELVHIKGEPSTSIHALVRVTWKMHFRNHNSALRFGKILDYVQSRAMISAKVLALISCSSTLCRWHIVLIICDAKQSVQLLNLATCTQDFTKFLLFIKMHLPSTFILRYVRAKMIMHAFYDWSWSTGLLISKTK